MLRGNNKLTETMQIRGWVRSYAEQPPRILFNYNFPKYNNDKQLTYDVPLLLFSFFSFFFFFRGC